MPATNPQSDPMAYQSAMARQNDPNRPNRPKRAQVRGAAQFMARLREICTEDEPDNPQCPTDVNGERCCYDLGHDGPCETAQDVAQKTVDAGGCER